MTDRSIDTGIVVLNWNGFEDTVHCLVSIRDRCTVPASVVVCDNGSTDASVRMIRKWLNKQVGVKRVVDQQANYGAINNKYSYINCITVYEGQDESTWAGKSIKLIVLEENVGFASGNNVGVELALSRGCRNVVLLNNDTVLTEGAIDKLISALEATPQIGAAGPLVLEHQTGEDWQRPERRKVGPLGWAVKGVLFSLVRRGIKIWPYCKFWECGGSSTTVEVLPGSCIAITKEAWRACNGLDERTFLFFEEKILAARLSNANYAQLFVPTATVYHKWSRSVDRLGIAKWKFYAESCLYYFREYYKVGSIGVVFIKIYLILILLSRVVWRNSSCSMKTAFDEALRIMRI